MTALLRTILCNTIALSLVACAVPAQVQRPEPKQLSNLLSESDRVVYQHPASFAQALPGTVNTTFTNGIYLQTNREVVLLAYSPRENIFTRTFSVPIADIDFVAVESTGMFNHLQQLQIFSHGLIYVALLSSSANAQAGGKEQTTLALSALTVLGIRQGPPHRRISPPFLGPTLVPIPVGK